MEVMKTAGLDSEMPRLSVPTGAKGPGGYGGYCGLGRPGTFLDLEVWVGGRCFRARSIANGHLLAFAKCSALAAT